MKIIFIITSLEGFGGTNRVATLLANSLIHTYQVIILSKDCEVNTYPLDRRVEDIKFTGNDFNFVRQCKQYIAQNQPDRVIIHTMSKLTPALILVGIKADSIWSIEHISFEFHSVLFKFLRKYVYKKIDKVIALTENDAFNYNSFRKNIHVIENASPLPIASQKNTSDSKIILSIGRLTSQKGYDLLINAWLLIEQCYPDWALHIYGEGEDRGRLEQIIRDHKLNNIVLKGLSEDVQNAYDNADIYVMSSRFEGLPVVLIEAQSRGLPIVSFNCPSGPAEIVHHNVDGYLVENGNIKKLAEKISYLIENEDIRKAFSDKALVSAERYKLEHIIDKWTALIESGNE